MKKNSGNKSDGAAKQSKPKASTESKVAPAASAIRAPKRKKVDPALAEKVTAAPTKPLKKITAAKARSAKLKEGKSSAKTPKPKKSATQVSTAALAPTEPPLPQAATDELKLAAIHGKASMISPVPTSSTENAAPPLAPVARAAAVKESPPKPELKAKPGKRPPRSAEASRPEVKIPSLLLEGDLPPSPSISGPGARYALAPQPVIHAPPSTTGELPEAYGTGRVFLAARDPHWLYVSWDFTLEQQIKYNAQSRDRHLVIRVFTPAEPTPAIPEVHVHPESRNWFLHVPFAETSYFAEIGFYDTTGTWRRVAISSKTLTPPDAPSKDLSAEFATIPADVTFQEVVEAVQQFVAITRNEPLLDAVALASEAQREGATASPQRHEEPALPEVSKTRIRPAPGFSGRSRPTTEPLPIQINPADEWSEEQTLALSRLIHIDSFRRVWMGSMEITELVRRQLEEEVASIAAAKRKRPVISAQPDVSREQENISSPAGGEFQKSGRFWFKINAELIIYGATEPDAKVTIADRLIKLRPDGTFSFRFSLPDGRYQLPAIAISADGDHGREARLEFSRSTDYHGQVEAHSQDSTLRPPRPDHLE